MLTVRVFCTVLDGGWSCPISSSSFFDQDFPIHQVECFGVINKHNICFSLRLSECYFSILKFLMTCIPLLPLAFLLEFSWRSWMRCIPKWFLRSYSDILCLLFLCSVSWLRSAWGIRPVRMHFLKRTVQYCSSFFFGVLYVFIENNVRSSCLSISCFFMVVATSNDVMWCAQRHFPLILDWWRRLLL